MLKEYPDVLTVEQVAQILNIGINAAYRLVNSHEIGCRQTITAGYCQKGATT